MLKENKNDPKIPFEAVHTCGGQKITKDERKIIRLTVNGYEHEMQVDPNWTLAEVLRDKLGLTGTKLACDDGACGSCTVLSDGVPILSCMTLAIECVGKNILTIEGLSQNGKLHPLQESFAKPEHWLQCGLCAPGMIMSAKALLDNNQNPTEDEIKECLSSNICRCGNYIRAVEAVKYVVGGDKNNGGGI